MKQQIILGGGCFWCTEAVFDRVRGVTSVISGYVGPLGLERPEYNLVASGKTEFVESVQIEWNQDVLPLSELLILFFATHNPEQVNGQGADLGPQYRSLIAIQDASQLDTVNEVMSEVSEQLGVPLATEIWEESAFFSAESYHLDFFAKQPYHPYCQAVISPKLAKLFAKITQRKPLLELSELENLDDALLVGRLSPLEYRVLRQKGTEPAFVNEFWDNHDEGTFACALCGLDLFDSSAKFDSGTGWPSFTKPISLEAIALEGDDSHGMVRDEVVCSRCRSHLGHVFPDGPAPLRTRYCMNSASLVFNPKYSAPEA